MTKYKSFPFLDGDGPITVDQAASFALSELGRVRPGGFVETEDVNRVVRGLSLVQPWVQGAHYRMMEAQAKHLIACTKIEEANTRFFSLKARAMALFHAFNADLFRLEQEARGVMPPTDQRSWAAGKVEDPFDVRSRLQLTPGQQDGAAWAWPDGQRTAGGSILPSYTPVRANADRDLKHAKELVADASMVPAVLVHHGDLVLSDDPVKSAGPKQIVFKSAGKLMTQGEDSILIESSWKAARILSSARDASTVDPLTVDLLATRAVAVLHDHKILARVSAP
jgi:hypothetical protein